MSGFQDLVANVAFWLEGGVIPTELGYGWYCGNSFGLFWVNDIFPFYACLNFLFVIQLANTFDVV